MEAGPALTQEKLMAECVASDNRSDLKTKLLGYGGRRAFVQDSPFPGELLTRGQVFRPDRRLRVPGPSYQAHRPAVLHYIAHHFLDRPGDLALVTGYKLDEQEVWTPGSWLWDGQRVLDHAGAVLYFGVKLAPEEAFEFVSATMAALLSGRGRSTRDGNLTTALV